MRVVFALETHAERCGIVEVIPEDYYHERTGEIMSGNPLGLSIGDKVIVHHYSFYGKIGVNRGFTIQDNVVLDGRNIFPLKSS